MAGNIVKEAFAGLIGRRVRTAGVRGGFGEEDDSYEEESGGEEERPKVERKLMKAVFKDEDEDEKSGCFWSFVVSRVW
ncbi:hypothetical protein F3Y22_tig00110809pilonHSYRG00231 [Hibiscus syriacus]|uniref:Uncharacterized protein n=1 Tax=Hibiscus syriacus TaxID=106335 RepID=A0A6A2ZNF1_HIBSY|nr:hypothetical protein F3Y22_tig00110809pilonHSYRG00231 [Hibiscus syriacus]